MGLSGCLKGSLIGCVILLVAGILIAGVGGYFAHHWLSNALATNDSDYGKKITALQRSHHFESPAGGVLKEDQLLRFFGVVRGVGNFIKTHRTEWERIQTEGEKSRKPYLDGILYWLRFGNEFRDTFLKSLEEQRMSLAEYRFVHKEALKAMGALMKKEAEKLADEGSQKPGERKEQIERRKGELAKSLEKDEGLRKIYSEVSEVPEQNIRMILTHKEEAQNLIPMAPPAGMLFPLLSEDESPL